MNDSILKHGVLICKKCNALWNRDENSSRNIYKIAYNAINKKERPSYLCHQKKEDDDENKELITKKPIKKCKIVKTKKIVNIKNIIFKNEIYLFNYIFSVILKIILCQQ